MVYGIGRVRFMHSLNRNLPGIIIRVVAGVRIPYLYCYTDDLPPVYWLELYLDKQTQRDRKLFLQENDRVLYCYNNIVLYNYCNNNLLKLRLINMV